MASQCQISTSAFLITRHVFAFRIVKRRTRGRPGLAGADVAAGERVLDPVRPFGRLGREQAGGRRLRVVAQEVECARTEDGGETGASDVFSDISTVQLGLHAAPSGTVMTQP